MQTVYLDTSHIAMLSKEWENQTPAIIDFMAKWNSAGYSLSLSKAHFGEIAEHRSESTRQSRYTLLGNLLPIKFSSNSFSTTEILLELREQGLVDASLSVEVFDSEINNAEELQAISSLIEIPLLNGLFNLIGIAHDHSWQAERTKDREPKAKKQRIRDIPNDPISADAMSEIKANVDAKLNGLNDQLPEDFTEILRRGNSAVANLLDGFSEIASTEGGRTALSDFLGLDAFNQKQMSTPIKDALENFKFHLLIKQASDFCGIPTEKITENVSIDACPGIYLSMSIKNNLLLANDVSPSNEYDLEHIQYLPYVDIFYADRRICEITKQILRKGDLPDKIKVIKPPRSVPNSLESLAKSLFVSN